MQLEVLPAKKGDCLILHCGGADDPGLVLIDGGPAGVWSKTLQPRLRAIREERGLADDAPLTIDLLVVSHVDDDHINGVLSLFEAMKQRKEDGLPPLFAIDRLWHNSFDDIIGNDETVALVKQSQFGPASTGEQIEEAVYDAELGVARDAALILAGIAQGDSLRRLADLLEIPINPEFDDGLVQTSCDGGAFTVSIRDVELVIAGPRRGELQKLQAEHDQWLKDHPRPTSVALLAALDDESVANLSSIVLLARDPAGKSILLTGDARSDKVLGGLEDAGVIAAGASLAVDVLKMPHHGSIRNLDAEFLTRMPAKTYVFSGDGKHGNPDRETFELLFATRPGAAMELVVTYPVASIDPERKKEFDKERRNRIKKGKPGGPEWDDAVNALGTLFTALPAGTVLVEPGAGAILV